MRIGRVVGPAPVASWGATFILDINHHHNYLPSNMIRTKDIQIISQATKFVVKNRHPHGYTMAAYLVDGKTVISYGLNDYQKTHAKTPQNGRYVLPCHAEIKVLAKYIIRNKKISKDLSLYVVGLTMGKSDNFVISSKPCESCQKFIRSIGIKRVVYIDNLDGRVEIKEMIV